MTKEDNFIAAYERHAATLLKAVEANKAALFDALAADITSVTAEFDGEGDSGGIESVLACSGDTRIELPAGSVPFHQVQFGADASVMTQQTLLRPSRASVMTASPRPMADGKTMTVRSAPSRSTSLPEPSNWNSTGASATSPPARMNFKGGDNAACLLSLSFQRENLGRHGRGLCAHP
jgi:hypothetical protein